jgi:hypothetical protein
MRAAGALRRAVDRPRGHQRGLRCTGRNPRDDVSKIRNALNHPGATVVNGARVDVFFALAQGAAPPQLIDTNLLRFRWFRRMPKKRALRVRMLAVDGGKPHELLDLIQRYRRAVYAQGVPADFAAPAPTASASASSV